MIFHRRESSQAGDGGGGGGGEEGGEGERGREGGVEVRVLRKVRVVYFPPHPSPVSLLLFCNHQKEDLKIFSSNLE